MAERIKVWFDPEADFLEVTFSDAPGYMRETENDAVKEITPMMTPLELNRLGYRALIDTLGFDGIDSFLATV